MILKRLKLHNCIGILCGLGKETIEIDFDKFSPGLILIQGKSGTGKSTILNNLHPYRSVGRDNFGKHFLEDGYRELEFEFRGNRYLSQIYLDKAQLFKNDILLNDSQKVSVYDEVVEDEIGNKDTFFDLLFAGRKFKNVLEMTKGEKKQLVVDYLLSHLKKNEDYLETCKKEQQQLIERQKRYTIKLEEKDKVKENLQLNKERLDTIHGEIEELEFQKSNIDIETEKGKYQKYLKQERENQELKLTVTEQEAKLETLVLTLDNEKRLYNSHLQKYNSVKLKYAGLKQELKDVEKPNYTEDEVNKLIEDAYKIIEEETEKKRESESVYSRIELEIGYIEKSLKELTKSQLPCDSELQVQCPLTKQMNLTGLIKETQEKLAEWTEKRDSFKIYEYDDSDHRYMIKELKKKLDYISQYKNNIEKLKRKEELQQEGKELKTIKEEFESKLPELTKAVVEQEEKIKNLKLDIADKYSDNSENIEILEKRIRQIEDTILKLKQDVKNLQEKIQEDKKTLKELQKYQERIDELDSEILQYDNLIKFFGKDGVMMYELEIAGDEISEVANELLKNYQNKEIKIKFETMKPDSKGVMKDVFDIQCSINRGDWQTYLSDGESVLVSNSIREAMSYLKQNKEYQTVFLDELDGSIDSESRVGFLKLLEQGNEMNGRKNVFLISHSEEVKSYCEQSITLKNGELLVC